MKTGQIGPTNQLPRFSDQWDNQIEEDIAAGLLGELAAEAIAEHRAGGAPPMPSNEKVGEF